MMPLVLTLALAVPFQDDWTEFRKLARDSDPDKRCQAVEKIKEYADLRMTQALLPLMGDLHPRVRRRAAEAVRRADGAGVDEFLRTAGLRHPQKLARVSAAECLGARGESKAVEALQASLADPEPDVRAAVCLALGQLEARAAADRLETLFSRDASWQGRAAALEAMASADPERAAKLALRASADRPAYQVRLAAALIAPRLDRAVALDVLRRALADVDWRVRVQATESAVEVRDRALIGPLIDALAKERGRLRWDLSLALRDLTGKELGFDAKTWKAWWEANESRFEMPPPGGPGGQMPRADSGIQFFTIPVLSTRAAFVLDLSGSMRDPAPRRAGAEPATKLDIAKREMVRTIHSLPEDTWFNLILLGCEQDGSYARAQKRWKKGLMPATPAARADAAAFTNRLEARGWTNIWDGLELAFEDEAVDTLYLYSDGGASRGVFIATAEILSELRLMNKYRKIMIHTIEVPAEKPNTADNIRLLKGIAEGTRGMYRLAE